MPVIQDGRSLYNFKDIPPVATSDDLVDQVLSKTQRKTPTQVHPQFKQSRIRSFYMRKVKYAQSTFHERLMTILTKFPRLQDIHPFYGNLMRVLYDQDHYKLALGQCNAVRNIVDNIAKDYVRLLKYADSPYKAKMLKRAALGRMCTTVKKLGDALKYLEEVRQQLSRLPSINPYTRTIVLAGYPNIGKSSFMNCISRANVEVQPYAFTTTSLYVGHFDYNYMQWQVIDTPGVLDRPLASRNTIELVAITALTSLSAAIVYFIDISESCGFSFEEQIKLFHSLKPAFKGKPVVVALSKIDVKPASSLTPEQIAMIESLKDDLSEIVFKQCSSVTKEGVDSVQQAACDMLLRARVEKKIESKKAELALGRLFVTNVTPSPDRPPTIPAEVLEKRKRGEEAEMQDDDFIDHRQITEKMLEEEGGGPGVYQYDERKDYDLENPEWRYDLIPEVFDGKNIADFVDPDIERKLAELEAEEEEFLRLSEIDKTDNSQFERDEIMHKLLFRMVRRRELHKQMNRTKNHAVLRRKRANNDATEMAKKMEKVGLNGEAFLEKAPIRKLSAPNYDNLLKSDDEHDMVDDTEPKDGKDMKKVRKASSKRLRALALSRTQTEAGAIARRKFAKIPRVDLSMSAESKDLVQKKIHRDLKFFRHSERVGEADRFIGTAKPKHLFSGKRGSGKTDRR